ncbi:polysaccharide deacetylase (plasmid) [Legionella adelaidensis]|uniref:Polysaccharide deacetylase n=1 Tax=Legionella adelaidensis TaxID=45056 RepID=A0A0W0R2G7_9GAMM|nr:polysaccharide deacetylase family protein [Legionella adelaidensis]KTC65182.1 polysaccharide deacetylase [Legionella adelaidensis]VEH85076.1 polysaccharide deacetylase [Legionella adelaidensis]
MLKKLPILLASFSFCLSGYCAEEPKKIAITIDDLPFVGTTNGKPSNLQREHDRFIKIVDTLKEYNVPATGFVVAGTIEKDQWQLLEEFQKAGFQIGNHTYSHLNLNTTQAQKYMEDIARADQVLTPLYNGTKYFRYPYLAEGQGEKKAQVYEFLSAQNYVIAPVTIDTKDFRFNEELFHIPYRLREKNLPQLRKRYLSYIWSQTQRAEKLAGNKPVKQILLIHANLVNSHFLGDIIQMYKQNGYEFISLEEALAPPSSFIQPLYAGQKDDKKNSS